MNKKMNLFGMLALISLISAQATLARAGTEHGNGGGAHVCRNSSGEITSIQMYDLYEGLSERYQFKGPVLSGDSVDAVLERAHARVKTFGASLSAKIQAAEKLLLGNITPTQKTLVPTLDAHKVMVDRGCAYEQVAIWDDRVSKVFLNMELFNAMDDVNRAALYFHEATYWVARQYSQQVTSDDTREFVARVFLNEEVKTDIAKGFTQAGLETYKTGGFDDYFVVFKDRINWSNPDCYDYSMTGRNNDLSVTVKFESLNKDTARNRKDASLVVEEFRFSDLPSDRHALVIGDRVTIQTKEKNSVYRLHANYSYAGFNEIQYTAEFRSKTCSEVLTKRVQIAEGLLTQFDLEL